MHTREVRLGLVLYGGVSLAVYENGVAQELYRAVMGEGLYKLLGDLIDSDVVVDVISGTSAGGVNGVMLGYALAKGTDFRPSSKLWSEAGDIAALAGEYGSQNGMSVPSVLSSDYYQVQLADCFAKTLGGKGRQSSEEVDVFITSTDVHGVVSTVYDDLGHPIDVKTHRSLFKLKYRPGRVNDFGDSTQPDALAKLCRMTSCFPVAFRPVRVDGTSGDEALKRWGKLVGSAVFLDGGILNNKPFTSTIDAIATRTATREVERFLIYVEPDPEVFCSDRVETETPLAPNLWQAAWQAKMSLPGYQSIASDLEAVQAHNERAARVQKIVEALEDAAPWMPGSALQSEVAPDGLELSEPAYVMARYLQLRDAAVSCILNSPAGKRAFFRPQQAEGGTDERRSGRILVESFAAWPGDGLQTLREFDVYFRRRRIKHLMNRLMARAKDGEQVPVVVWDRLNHLYKLCEITEAGMVAVLNRNEFGWRALSGRYPNLDLLEKTARQQSLEAIATEIWGRVAQTLRVLLTGVAVSEAMDGEARRAFATGMDELAKDSGAAPGTNLNVLARLDQLLAAVAKEFLAEGKLKTLGEMLAGEMNRFLTIDRQLFLVGIGSNFESMDMIHVVRFSPADAQLGMSQGKVGDKVRGISLAAFGGFFRKDWRANDIMVGRLDAACLLTQCLLTREQLACVARRKGTQAGVVAQPSTVREAFPRLSEAAAETLANRINTLYIAAAAGGSGEWEQLVEELVRAAHEEIVAVEWPEVLVCAVEQNAAWGFRPAGKDAFSLATDPKSQVWQGCMPGRARDRAAMHDTCLEVARAALKGNRLPSFVPGTPRPDFLSSMPRRSVAGLGGDALGRVLRGVLQPPQDPGMAPEPMLPRTLRRVTDFAVAGVALAVLQTWLLVRSLVRPRHA